MDAEFWIYIIIGIIYFLSRFLKKPEQVPGETPDTQRREIKRRAAKEQPATEVTRPMTFEELLREITEGKQPPKARPEPVPTYERYETDPGEEAKSLEDVSVDEEANVRRWKPYESIPAGNVERRSLEETMRLEDTVVDFRKFDAFQSRAQKKLSDDYIKLIRNPETLRQAVVMSEILKRKF